LEDGRFRGVLDEGFWAIVGANGGYLAALSLHAMQRELDDATRSPRSLHIRFLAATKAGAVEIAVERLKVGRSIATLTATMRQGDVVVVVASAVFGAAASAVAFNDTTPPVVPALDDCSPLPKLVPINHQYDLLRGFGGDYRKGERALSGGYIRLAEARPLDALLLAALWDAWAPAAMYRRIDTKFGGGVPTIEASVLFRQPMPRPTVAPGDYVVMRVESTLVVDGYLEESCEIWSRDGELLVQSRQLAMLY
jgi:acyl-CoA thioesterase